METARGVLKNTVWSEKDVQERTLLGASEPTIIP